MGLRAQGLGLLEKNKQLGQSQIILFDFEQGFDLSELCLLFRH